MAEQQYISVGRRKTSIARVYLKNGTGIIVVNKKRTLSDVLHRKDLIEDALKPLKAVNQASQWDILINLQGGGVSSQAGAVSHGIARALLRADEANRVVLREHSLLTRDPRMVERKKYGQRGARKKFQFSKR